MSTGVFLAVLFAALLHAIWNALVRGHADRALMMTAVTLGHVPAALVALAFAPLPYVASWPYIAAGAALHLVYQLALAKSYEEGELTHSYPIARGSAPLIVALVSVTLLGETLDRWALIGIALIGAGVISLVFVRRDAGSLAPRAAGWALLTGCFTAAYSLVDGWGARLGGSAVGFYACLALLNAVAMIAVMTWRSPDMLGAIAQCHKRRALLGGTASFSAFAIVIWAFTRAPIATVSALRETSIVFAMAIGVFVLRETMDLRRLVSTMLAMGGMVALRLSRS